MHCCNRVNAKCCFISLSHIFRLKVCVMLKIRCNYAHLECNKQNENIRFSIQAVFVCACVRALQRTNENERELIQTQQTIHSNGKYFNRLYKPCIQIFQVASISFFVLSSHFCWSCVCSISLLHWHCIQPLFRFGALNVY